MLQFLKKIEKYLFLQKNTKTISTYIFPPSLPHINPNMNHLKSSTLPKHFWTLLHITEPQTLLHITEPWTLPHPTDK